MEKETVVGSSDVAEPNRRPPLEISSPFLGFPSHSDPYSLALSLRVKQRQRYESIHGVKMHSESDKNHLFGDACLHGYAYTFVDARQRQRRV